MGGNIVIWGLLTGLITGVVWTSIVLLGRQKRLTDEQRSLRAELERRFDALEAVDVHVAELEERLDFAERLLRAERAQERLPPPPAS
jgi:uncharacterized SAM-binding protein YcdF (DUF218 family)